ncbi:hypothetical protein [Rhizobacter sp. P5_C2]
MLTTDEARMQHIERTFDAVRGLVGLTDGHVDAGCAALGMIAPMLNEGSRQWTQIADLALPTVVRLTRSAVVALEPLPTWESSAIRNALDKCDGGGQPEQSRVLQVLGLGALMPFELTLGFEALGKASTVRRLRHALDLYMACAMVG